MHASQAPLRAWPVGDVRARWPEGDRGGPRDDASHTWRPCAPGHVRADAGPPPIRPLWEGAFMRLWLHACGEAEHSKDRPPFPSPAPAGLSARGGAHPARLRDVTRSPHTALPRPRSVPPLRLAGPSRRRGFSAGTCMDAAPGPAEASACWSPAGRPSPPCRAAAWARARSHAHAASFARGPPTRPRRVCLSPALACLSGGWHKAAEKIGRRGASAQKESPPGRAGRAVLQGSPIATLSLAGEPALDGVLWSPSPLLPCLVQMLPAQIITIV